MSKHPDWARLEAWITEAFVGQMRKGGHEYMVQHSIRIGRRLRAKGRDAITVFGGYTHDVLEDTDRCIDQLRVVAREMLGADAETGVQLAKTCCYTDAEYALTKAERKVAACARWTSTPDVRVWYIKIEDVFDNRADANIVSDAFFETYTGWADPLAEALEANIARGYPVPIA